MAAKAQEIRVGLFAAITLALLATVLIVFGGMRFWEHSDHYRIVFDGSVIGLEPGAEVYLNGIKVGSVEDLGVPPDDIRKVAIKIKVKRGTPIHADTRAMLQYAGITGLKIIDLRDGTMATPLLADGADITAGTGILDKLEAQAQTIVDQTTVLMKRADEVMRGAGAVMQRANVLTDSLIAVAGPAKTAATNLAAMSGSLRAMVDENRAGLRATLASIRHTTDGATQLVDGASQLIDGQVAPLLTGAGDVVTELKQLIGANAGPLRAAVFDLRQASRSFKELARDVRQQPSRLLFSSAPAERQLP